MKQGRFYGLNDFRRFSAGDLVRVVTDWGVPSQAEPMNAWLALKERPDDLTLDRLGRISHHALDPEVRAEAASMYDALSESPMVLAVA